MRILRKAQVREKTGLSNATIDRKERASKFPARIQLGEKAVGWLESELDDWIKRQIAERDSKSPGLIMVWRSQASPGEALDRKRRPGRGSALENTGKEQRRRNSRPQARAVAFRLFAPQRRV